MFFLFGTGANTCQGVTNGILILIKKNLVKLMKKSIYLNLFQTKLAKKSNDLFENDIGHCGPISRSLGFVWVFHSSLSYK